MKGDDCLLLTDGTADITNDEFPFLIEQAKKFKANAVFLRKQLSGSYKPQAYIFDFTGQRLGVGNEEEALKIQKRIWTSGDAPLACLFFNTEIKIIDCTTPINENRKLPNLPNRTP